MSEVYTQGGTQMGGGPVRVMRRPQRPFAEMQTHADLTVAETRISHRNEISLHEEGACNESKVINSHVPDVLFR